jgi:hypothetical protein
MRPERVEHRGGKGLVLAHRCVVCGFVRFNRIADDPVQGDDIDAIIALMSGAGRERQQLCQETTERSVHDRKRRKLP